MTEQELDPTFRLMRAQAEAETLRMTFCLLEAALRGSIRGNGLGLVQRFVARVVACVVASASASYRKRLEDGK